jgi:hypothetical protein
MEDYFISWNRKVLGLTYSFIKTVYTATLFLEDEKSGGLGSALGLASSLGLDLVVAEASLRIKFNGAV